MIGDEAQDVTWSLGKYPGGDDGRMRRQSWQRKEVY